MVKLLFKLDDCVYDMEIKESIFKAVVKPKSRKNEIVSYNTNKNAYIVDIKEKAEDNKANIELVRFLSKELGRKVKIKSGLRSKLKIIGVVGKFSLRSECRRVRT